MKKKSETQEDKNTFKNIYYLGFTSLFTDISSEMAFSILPAFILELPGAGAAILGVIEGVAEALSYSLRAISGIFSDRLRKRKIMVFIGYAFSTSVKPFFALAQVAYDVLVVRVSDRIGKAIRTAPRDALVAESVPEECRGAAFGLHRTLDQTGAIIGPLIATALMLLLGITFRTIFWLSFIPGFIALLIILFLVQERVGKSSGEFKLLSGMRNVLKGDFTLLLVIVGIFSLGAFNFSFIIINAKNAGFSDPFIPLVYAVVNIAHVAIAIPAGVYSDRIGKEKGLTIGYAFFLVTVLLLHFIPQTGFYPFLTAAIYGLYLGITETVQRALVPKYVESALRGTAYGLYYFVVGSAFLVANIVVGSLWQLYSGPSVAAIYSAILSFTAMIGMSIFLFHQERSMSGKRD